MLAILEGEDIKYSVIGSLTPTDHVRLSEEDGSAPSNRVSSAGEEQSIALPLSPSWEPTHATMLKTQSALLK